jgi:hypothetical protein
MLHVQQSAPTWLAQKLLFRSARAALRSPASQITVTRYTTAVGAPQTCYTTRSVTASDSVGSTVAGQRAAIIA